jgi:hypothetical protein
MLRTIQVTTVSSIQSMPVEHVFSVLFATSVHESPKWNSKKAAPVGGLLHGYQAGVQVPPGLLVGVVTDVQTEPWVAQMATP